MKLAKLSDYKTQIKPSMSGTMVALCNDASSGLSVAQIESARAEDIPMEMFTAFIIVMQERFNRVAKDFYLEYLHQSFNESMGASEFYAAFMDAPKNEFNWQDIAPYVHGHVEEQRENGPDLFSRSVAEMMSSANDDLN